MDTPSVVLAIVLAETAVGGLWLTWLAPTWGKVRHGYELLLGGTLLAMLWGARASLATPLSVLRSPEGGAGVGDAAALAQVVQDAERLQLSLLVALLLGVAALVVLLLPVPDVLARGLGVASALAGTVGFWVLADLRAVLDGGSPLLALGELALGAVLLGGIWTGMILGHWYLVERRLSNRYMVWIAWMNVGAVVAGLGSVLLSTGNPAPIAAGFSPLLDVPSMTVTLGLGTLALIAVIAAFNVKLANEGGRSIQASTGMFYLAVIVAPAVEFASKVRYF